MGRFITVLSGSAPSELTSDYFDTVVMTGDATAKRNGLIDSRSIVSSDVYEDLDSANIDGSKGTYFPPDLMTTPNNPFSATAYTSSVDGIIIPTNFRTRPTSSITSSQNTLVGPTNPLDTVSVSYTSYLSASNAVQAVLDSATGGGPYARLGNNPGRTVHSIWHDENVAYFAWDDFTPGQPTLEARNTLSGISPSASSGLVYLSMSREYLNDFNGSASIVATLRYASSSGTSFSGQNSTAASLSTTVAITALSNTANQATKYYTWNPGTVYKNSGSLVDAQSSDGLNLSYTVTYYDPVITSSAGQSATITRNSGASFTVNGTTITNGAWIKIGTT